MFHCNGWCFTWAVTAAGGDARLPARRSTRRSSGGCSTRSGVTHLCGAPTVLVMLGADAAARRLERPVRVTTAGAPPPPAVIARTEELGFAINHVYGLTETYGPITICEWNPDWDELRRRGARAAEGAPGRRLRHRRPRARRRRGDARRARRRRDDGRGRHARQQRDEGLLRATRRPRPRRSAAAGSTPATSA